MRDPLLGIGERDRPGRGSWRPADCIQRGMLSAEAKSRGRDARAPKRITLFRFTSCSGEITYG